MKAALGEEEKREAAAFGFTPEDYADARSNVDVWPDNWRYVRLFEALSTQWRTGFAGPTGLDYGVMPNVLRMLGFPRADWPETFELVRMMEMEALDEMHGKKPLSDG